MAQISISATDAFLVHRLKVWAKQQRENGHEVENEELQETRDLGLTLAVAGIVLQVADMVGAVDWAKQEIREWFTELPKKEGRKPLHVTVIDKRTGETAHFDLES